MSRSANIGSMSVTIRADTNPFTKGLIGARKQLASFTQSVGKTIFSLKGLGAALAGGAMANAAKQSLQFADALGKASDRIGIATSALHGFRHAANLSGVEAATLDTSLQRMIANLAEAGAGTGTATTALKRMGLDAKTLAAMAPDQQLLAIADGMTKLGTQGERTAAAMDIFGRGGIGMLDMLKGGSAGVMQMTDELKNLGGALSRDAAARAEEANDALTRVGVAVDAIKVSLAVGLAPALTSAANGLASFIGTGEKMGVLADIVHTLKLAFLGLRASVTGIIASIVEKFDQLHRVIVEVVNQIPGVEVKSSQFVASLSASMRAAAGQTQKDFNAALIAPTPSERMRAQIRPQSPVVAQTPSSANPNAASGITGALGGLLDRGKMKAQRFAMETGFQAKMLAQFAAFMGGGLLQRANAISPQALSNASIGAVDANSRAGFSQRARAMRNDPALRLQKDQLAQLKIIASNTKAEQAVAANFA